MSLTANLEEMYSLNVLIDFIVNIWGTHYFGIISTMESNNTYMKFKL